MPRTRASALNSSVVGVDEPVQTAIRVLVSDKRELGERARGTHCQ